MLIYSVICILLGYAFSSTSNTSVPGSLSEVIKLFQSLNINRGAENGYHTTLETLPVPKPVLLSAIHNLAPDLLSRATDPADNYEHLQPKDSDVVDASIEYDNRRFLDWLKKVFGWNDEKGKLVEKHKGDDKGNSNGYDHGYDHGFDHGYGNLTTTARPYQNGITSINILANTKIRKKFRVEDNVNDTPQKRRGMDWFKTFFGATTAVPPTTLKLSTETTELRARQTRGRTNMTMVLTKLNGVLEQLNENLYVQNLNANMTEGYFVLKMPVLTNASRDLYRRKRDAVVALTHSNDTLNAHNTTRLLTNRANANTIVRMPSNYEKLNENNTEHNNIKGSSREFNNKLVNYLTLAFKEIKQKLLPLNKLKQTYSSEDTYIIGYIIANIDILEVNVDKLIAELELRKFVGDENKLLELFDKLKASSDVIGNLIRVLKKFNKTNNKFLLQTN